MNKIVDKKPADEMTWIELDGASGEGGGQILRTALTLSMLTGQPFRIQRIRAGRAKPGLLRQHLVAVQAAAEISQATVHGAELGSQTLEFTPGVIRGGEFSFDIGSAGSTTLVAQTLIPALLFASQPSSLRIRGGTHNGMAPPADFLREVYQPLLQRMGAQTEIDCPRYGFYPAGGGELTVQVRPVDKLRAVHLKDRGVLRTLHATACVTGIPPRIAVRELEVLRDAFQLSRDTSRILELPAAWGPGNVILLRAEFEHVTEMVTAFGQKGVPAPQIAQQAAREMQEFLDSKAAVGEYLADQLLLLMAIAGEGSYTMSVLSEHTRTNAEVIRRFLPVSIQFTEEAKQLDCTVSAA